MARGLTCLHLADSHIGVDLPARPRSKRPRRGDEIIAGYRLALRPALQGEVDLVIHAGDLFDRPRPNQAALAAAITPLLDVAARGVPVVIVPGNHERCVLPESLLFSHPNLHVVREPTTLTFKLRSRRVAVVAVPCIRKRAAGEFAVALRATGWSRARADVNILAVHQTFESARCGPAGYRFRSGEDVVERAAVPREFDYVAAGHIHRHQVLESPHAGGPPIVYAGSTERITFAERDEPKGAVLVEAVGGKLVRRFQPHRVRPMVVAAMDVSGRSRAEIRDEAHRLVADLPLGAYALLRVTGSAPATTLRGLDLARSLRALRPDVLLKLAMRQVRVTPEDVARPARVAVGSPPRVFEPLGAGRGRVLDFKIERRRELPRTFGTYAFFDAGGRLLYVGKATNLRTRVATHRRGGATGGYYEGWPRRIAHVTVRVAACDLEALLVEAEMIRRYRPPFNRQLRSWQRYCYLCARDGGYGTLEVVDVPPRGRTRFGPYRSRASAERVAASASAFFQTAQCPPGAGREAGGLFAGSAGGRLCERYYRGLCAGPCAGRIDPAAYAERLAQRDALLAGVDDAALVRAEQRAVQGRAGGCDRGKGFPQAVGARKDSRTSDLTDWQPVPRKTWGPAAPGWPLLPLGGQPPSAGRTSAPLRSRLGWWEPGEVVPDCPPLQGGLQGGRTNECDRGKGFPHEVSARKDSRTSEISWGPAAPGWPSTGCKPVPQILVPQVLVPPVPVSQAPVPQVSAGEVAQDEQTLATLRDAFNHAALLRRAAALLGCRLVMPPCCGGRTVIRPSLGGLRLEMIPAGADGGKIAWEPPRNRRGGGAAVLPRDVMDGLCTAARELERLGIARAGGYASQLAASSSAAMPRCCRSIMVR